MEIRQTRDNNAGRGREDVHARVTDREREEELRLRRERRKRRKRRRRTRRLLTMAVLGILTVLAVVLGQRLDPKLVALLFTLIAAGLAALSYRRVLILARRRN